MPNHRLHGVMRPNETNAHCIRSRVLYHDRRVKNNLTVIVAIPVATVNRV